MIESFMRLPPLWHTLPSDQRGERRSHLYSIICKLTIPWDSITGLGSHASGQPRKVESLSDLMRQISCVRSHASDLTRQIVSVFQRHSSIFYYLFSYVLLWLIDSEILLRWAQIWHNLTCSYRQPTAYFERKFCQSYELYTYSSVFEWFMLSLQSLSLSHSFVR